MKYLDGTGSQKPMQESATCINKSKTKKKNKPPEFIQISHTSCTKAHILANGHIQCYLVQVIKT